MEKEKWEEELEELLIEYIGGKLGKEGIALFVCKLLSKQDKPVIKELNEKIDTIIIKSKNDYEGAQELASVLYESLAYSFCPSSVIKKLEKLSKYV